MPTDFILRPAEERDLPTIAAIYGESVLTGTASYEIEPPGLDEIRRRWQNVVSKGFPYFVADRSGTVIGYAYAGPYHSRPAYRYSVEDSIYIAPAAQRSGVGWALLSALIAHCEAGGFRQMIAVIGGTDPSASVGLHERLGFRKVGLVEASGFKHGGWLDTVLMQRALGPGRSTLPEGA